MTMKCGEINKSRNLGNLDSLIDFIAKMLAEEKLIEIELDRNRDIGEINHESQKSQFQDT